MDYQETGVQGSNTALLLKLFTRNLIFEKEVCALETFLAALENSALAPIEGCKASPDTGSPHSPPCWSFCRSSLADACFTPASQGHRLFYPLYPYFLALVHKLVCLITPGASLGMEDNPPPPGRAGQPHPSPEPFCPHFLQLYLCQNLRWCKLLIASMNTESNAVDVHVVCPPLGSTDTSVWRQGHLKSTNCLLTALDCLVTICLGQLPLII